jgi:hypothetical protein
MEHSDVNVTLIVRGVKMLKKTMYKALKVCYNSTLNKGVVYVEI